MKNILKVITLLLIVAAVVSAAGCAGKQTANNTTTTTTNTTSNPAPASVNTNTPTPAPVSQNPLTYTINIQNNAFNPSSVQIAVGGTVKWVNMDSVKHEPKGRIFDSGPIGQNGTFEYTFKSAGTYNYQCAIHPSMLGTIKVV
jgi:plastocyanin